MKRFLYLILFILALPIFGNAQNVTTEVSKTSLTSKTFSSYAKEVQNILVTDSKGIFRGFDFGASVENIKSAETAKFIADGKDFVIFKEKINEKEYAEIIYYLDETKKVKGFGIEFIITEDNYKEEENVVMDFQNYFNDKFGKFKVNSQNDEVWDAGKYTIEMGDASDGGSVMEIEIEIFPKVFKK